MDQVGIRTKVKGPFDKALASVVAALKEEGFGVLTEIDLRETLKKKLGVDFRRYAILGACNPPLAHRALQADLEVGVMLPCNVIVYEGDDGAVHVTAIDPMQTIAAQGPPELGEIAREVHDKLARVIGRVGETGG
jgi:uncharacterized protein (DUF302 family)